MDFSIGTIVVAFIILIPVFLRWNQALVILQNSKVPLQVWGISMLLGSLILIYVLEPLVEIRILGSIAQGILFSVLAFGGALLKETIWQRMREHRR